MKSKIDIVKHWYSRLPFSDHYRSKFDSLLTEYSSDIAAEFSENPQRNLLAALYRCDRLEQEYRQRGINKTVLLNTLEDIVRWVDIWYDLTGELGLMETAWLSRHFDCRLFALGRLQFCMGSSEHAVPDAGVSEGTPVLEVHIPSSGPLLFEECVRSVAMARRFFAAHFPEYPYRCFTCHSWLLDPTLKLFLKENSNILQFQKLFQVVQNDASDAALKYIFHWNTTRETLPACHAASHLATEIKRYVSSGGTLYESLGWFR